MAFLLPPQVYFILSYSSDFVTHLDSNFIVPHSSTENDGSNSSTSETTYSALLESVINNSEYNEIIDEYENGTITNSSALFDPHPYAFLEAQGHDVDAIKAGTLSCTTRSFVKDDEPNNIYMATYVENSASTPYYTEYMLMYTLTDEEMSDYKMVHRGVYIQAAFINDAISASKEVTIVSQANMTVEAHKGLSSSLGYYKPGRMSYVDIILESFNKSIEEFNVYCLPKYTSDSLMYADGKIFYAELRRGDSALTVTDNIFYGPYNRGTFDLGLQYYANKAEDVTYYQVPNRCIAAAVEADHNLQK